MPQIIPIKDLCKTNQISEMCKSSQEPIYVTKNGYANLVIMNAQAFDAKIKKCEIYEKLIEGEKDLLKGRYSDGDEVMQRLKAKYVE